MEKKYLLRNSVCLFRRGRGRDSQKKSSPHSEGTVILGEVQREAFPL
jgi:hypothetical protein